jgi:hypothetical protein
MKQSMDRIPTRMNTIQCLVDTPQLPPPQLILMETPTSIIGLTRRYLHRQAQLLRHYILRNNRRSITPHSRVHILRSQIIIQQPMHNSQALLLRMQHILRRKTPPQLRAASRQELLSHPVATGIPDILEVVGMKM